MSARLVWTSGCERDRRVLVGGEASWAGRDLEHVARVAIERDRIGAVAIRRDGDRPVVAVQRRLVVWIERLAADGESSGSRPRLIVPLVAVIEADPAKFGEDIAPLPESVAELVVIV